MHIKLVQAGPSTETMHGPCAGLKRIWNSKVVTLEICSTPKWNSSSKGGELKRKQITYLNDTMHFWWPVQHNQTVIYFKKAVLLTVTEAAAAVGVWNFFFGEWDIWGQETMRNKKQPEERTIQLYPMLPCLSPIWIDWQQWVFHHKENPSHTTYFHLITWPTLPLPLLKVFLPFTQMCPGNHEVLKSSTSVSRAEISASAHKDLTMNFNMGW